MSKYNFKVGDRVRIRSWDDMAKEFSHTATHIFASICGFVREMRPLCGQTATIQEIFGNEVRLANWNTTAADTSWSFTTGMLEPAFIIGHCYKVYDDPVGRKDNIIKVTSSEETHFHYKTIRGEDNLDSAGNNSVFADCLVPLYGKQVGEAIRAWDAKHGKTKVREIKRKAKIGETIKVVKAQNAPTYKNGDVLTVTRIGFGAGTWAKDSSGEEVYLYDSEYVVLENCKLTDRKAKVGDTIKILKDNCGKVKPGTVWKVKSIESNGDLNITHKDDDLVWACRHDNYVVISSGEQRKHAYTAEQIERAKELCGEMMVEFLDGYTSGGIDFIKNSNPAKTSCLITGDDEMKSGSTICNPNDEFNIWIGRFVALCKALKKPVPNFILEGGK